jgi:hypothetical protein
MAVKALLHENNTAETASSMMIFLKKSVIPDSLSPAQVLNTAQN